LLKKVPGFEKIEPLLEKKARRFFKKQPRFQKEAAEPLKRGAAGSRKGHT
jgi:hypothetical protein